MGRKAKFKKQRQQQITAKPKRKYAATEFVQQFEHMGYRAKIDLKQLPKTNRGNIAPEIPRSRIEPQL